MNGPDAGDLDGVITLVVIDDHPMLRDGVVRTLGAERDMRVVAEGGSAADALRLAREHLPDVILLDVSMPGGGLKAAADIAVACPIVKIIMLTVSQDEEHVMEAFKAGASGYVLKGVSGAEFASIVRDVHAGRNYITPELAAGLLQDADRRSARNDKRDALEALTPREREILQELAKGSSNKVIARTLALSEKTVKHHMTNILQKLRVHNRVEAAIMAKDAGA
ncbi:MAG: LuxR C-terminal-related transcriptional regulator [Betaproteobacteria bacterium]